MRLVLVINSLGVGGAEKVLLRLAYHWSKKNHQVFLINFLEEKNFYIIEENPNLQVINFGEKVTFKSINIINFVKFVFNSIFRIYKLQKKIKSLNPDLIITFMIGSNLLGLLANIFYKIPIIISERADPSNLSIPKFYKLLRRILYPYATALIVQTKDIANYFAKKLFKHKIFIIPNFVKTPNLSNLSDKNLLINTKFNNIKKLISIGRLDALKDHKTLIYAFSKIANIYLDLTLTIYGDGVLRNDLKNLIANLNLSNRIFLPGIDLNIEKHLLAADLFIFPSISEGFPNALCEAMSYGLPVIAADCSGNMNIITHEKDGLLFKCGDIEQLSIYILKLLNNHELAKELANNAKNIIERFNEQKILNLWDKVLEFSVLSQ